MKGVAFRPPSLQQALEMRAVLYARQVAQLPAPVAVPSVRRHRRVALPVLPAAQERNSARVRRKSSPRKHTSVATTRRKRYR